MTRMGRRKLDVLERNDRFLLKTEVPGVDHEDVSVTVRGRILQVRYDAYEGTDDDARYIRPDPDSFRATVRLPAEIDLRRLQVWVVNDVVVVTAPKRLFGMSRPARQSMARRAPAERKNFPV